MCISASKTLWFKAAQDCAHSGPAIPLPRFVEALENDFHESWKRSCAATGERNELKLGGLITHSMVHIFPPTS